MINLVHLIAQTMAGGTKRDRHALAGIAAVEVQTDEMPPAGPGWG